MTSSLRLCLGACQPAPPSPSIGSSTFHVERRLPSLRTLKPACAWCVDCSWTRGEAHLKRRGSVRPTGGRTAAFGPPSPIRNSRPEIGDRHLERRRYLYQLARCEGPAKPQGAWRRARRSRVRGAAAALEGQAPYQAVQEASSERKKILSVPLQRLLLRIQRNLSQTGLGARGELLSSSVEGQPRAVSSSGCLVQCR